MHDRIRSFRHLATERKRDLYKRDILAPTHPSIFSFRKNILAHAIAVVILLRPGVAVVLRPRQVAMRALLHRNRPPALVAHGRQVLIVVAVPIHDRLPLVPLSAVLRGPRHAARVLVGAGAARVGQRGQLRVPGLAVLGHLGELFGEQLEDVAIPLPRGHVLGGRAEDVVEDAVDALGVGAVGVAVGFHEEEDGPFVSVVRSGVPDPGGQLRVSFERDGALADCKA